MTIRRKKAKAEIRKPLRSNGLPKGIYSSNVTSIKIPVRFFTEVEQKFLKFAWNHKIPPDSHRNSEKKKNKARGITLPNFKLYYKAIVIKTVLYWQRTRHTDQWNRFENPEIK